MRSGLDRLLRPKSMAVIGGGFWGQNVLEKCQQMGFEGPIYAVHPSKDTLSGVPCVASISQLPEPPDAVFIGVNRHLTIQALRELSAMGAGGAVCFASGFLEAEAEDETGAELQQELLDAAGDMTVIGPNCYGFINYLDGALLWPDQHGGRRVDSGVAIIAQSSNIAINLTMQNRGLPIAYVLTAGNQAQTGLSAMGKAVLQDPRVTALGLYVEGLDDLAAFQNLAQTAQKLGKKIVALKIGKSDQAQAATVSHTASLAGSSIGASALFKRLGVAEVSSLPHLLETLKLCHSLGDLASADMASMSCSGGEASLIADLALNHAVQFPDLTSSQRKNLGTVLGPMVKLANPLDYHTYIWGDTSAITQMFTAMLEPHLAIAVVILDIPRKDRCSPDAWTEVLPCLKAARDATGVPIALVTSLPENLPEDIAIQLLQDHIVPFYGLDEALAAIAAVGNLHNQDHQPIAIGTVPKALKTLTEAASKSALEPYGITLPRAQTAQSAQAAAKAAKAIGFPVVLKGQGIAHKTEAGAVALNLCSTEEVTAAAERMPTQTFLVEQQVEPGIELLVGVLRDPAHGYILTLAAGGTMTEVITDSASLILPSSEQAILDALNTLKIAKLLHGYRGKPAADLDSIVKTVMAVQDFVMANLDKIAEVEINPLICGPNHATTADALIIIGE